ncbi:hypothetical protein BH23ACT5_BH23ACT5_21450 [soil metagenome]
MVAHLGVIDGDQPYVSPLSYVLIEGDVCFRTGAGRRIDAIRSHPQVCIEVSEFGDGGGWESVIAWGEAREVDDDHTAQEVIAGLLAKYRAALSSPLSPGAVFPEAGIVVKVALKRVSGRSSGSYFGVTTRPGRL